MSRYTNWMCSVSNISTWTISIRYGRIDSQKKLWQRADDCFILCKKQSTLTDEAEK